MRSSRRWYVLSVSLPVVGLMQFLLWVFGPSQVSAVGSGVAAAVISWTAYTWGARRASRAFIEGIMTGRPFDTTAQMADGMEAAIDAAREAAEL